MLINCPECNKEISDKAVSCPNCGCPVNQLNINLDNDDSELLNYPELPEDLSIGKQIANWAYNAAMEGIYENNNSSIDKIPSGKVHVLLHRKGLCITSSFFVPVQQIHYSQIISAFEISQKEIENKSTIGRAVAGGLIFGPLGAVIGGVSGIGSKNIMKYYLCINYWDIETRKPIVISIGCKISGLGFIRRLESEKISIS